MALLVPCCVSCASGTWRSSIGSSWSSTRPDRPHRRDRRRQVASSSGRSACSSAAAPPPTSSAPGEDAGGRSRPSSTRPDGDERHRPPRDLRPGTQPRASSTTIAGHHRRACARPAARSSICTASTNISCCSIPPRISTCSTRSAASATPARDGRRAFAAWQRARGRARASADRRAREGSARRASSASSSTRSIASRRQPAKTTS